MATTTPNAARVAAARRWYRRQGLDAIDAGPIVAAVTPAHPSTWDANWLQAGSDATPTAVLDALARHFPHGWRVVVADALTPAAVEATLALAGFEAAVTVIEMATAMPVAMRPPPPIELSAVDDANWADFVALVEIDQREGKRTGQHDEAVGAGLIETMRRRRGVCDYWLISAAGEQIGYGMTAVCPNRLGLIESLFTLPQHRGRGLMSGFIVRAARRLRDAGCDAVFLDAHAHDTPKQLYARLGFVPVAVTRTWVREVKR